MHVDGQLRWTDESATELGDLVPMDRRWKYRSFGKYMMLAPMDDAKEESKDASANIDVQAIKDDPNL